MKKLAIVGAGSSGLITLKTAQDYLEGWEITCFEKSDSVQGCWGNPYPDFVSTSTKYTTQFSCFQKYEAFVDPKGEYEEFFKGGEYGEYLEEFAEKFDLKKSIRFQTAVKCVERDGQSWKVTTEYGEELFSELIVCTGLTESPKRVKTEIPTVKTISEVESVRGKTVVVVGGGESAADLANRLSQVDRRNTVYLSLKSGIRVSPRYHPIRGVPSDYLRNRLMLGIDPELRNKIGQKFVEARIRYQELFERFFSSRKQEGVSELRKEWDYKLTKASKDKLFNMFHNKSDGFLEAVGEGRIQIVGAPTDETFQEFYEFQSENTVSVEPELLIPMIGFQSNLKSLFAEEVQVKDFYLGCEHHIFANLFAVGFARPIIGNIPSISEQQALYAVKRIAGEIEAQELSCLYAEERERLQLQFPSLNLEVIYPVEMFPYCDTLASLGGTLPEFSKATFRSPATTLHYSNYIQSGEETVYLPQKLNFLLSMISKFGAR